MTGSSGFSHDKKFHCKSGETNPNKSFDLSRASWVTQLLRPLSRFIFPGKEPPEQRREGKSSGSVRAPGTAVSAQGREAQQDMLSTSCLAALEMNLQVDLSHTFLMGLPLAAARTS